jgi:integrase
VTTDARNTSRFDAIGESAPTVIKRAVRGRLPNAAYRPREYLTPKEIEALMAAARKRNRYGHRDYTAILLAYRHGMRASELCRLRWDQIDFQRGLIAVIRLKNGTSCEQPLGGIEIRALRRLQRENEPSRYVFLTERGGPMTRAGFRFMIERTGIAAKLPFKIHPHVLRHSCGYKLANDGVDTRTIQHYLGHRNIQHTTKYTELSPRRFDNLWQD